MAERKTSFAQGEYYHLYNRGVEKRNIFLDDSDYKKIIYLMYICNTERSIALRDISENFDRGESIVDIGAYCLMKNHFHILIKEKKEGGTTAYMRKLLTAYSMYFNKKYKRTGKLWQGVFQSAHADSDRYLKYLYSYIHLNPCKIIDVNWRDNASLSEKKFFDFISNYKYSSLPFYQNKAEGYSKKIINKTGFPDYFTSKAGHKRELLGWINYNTITP